MSEQKKPALPSVLFVELTYSPTQVGLPAGYVYWTAADRQDKYGSRTEYVPRERLEEAERKIKELEEASYSTIDSLESRLALAIEALETAEEDLFEYGSHDDGCPAWDITELDRICKCGLVEAHQRICKALAKLSPAAEEPVERGCE